MGTLVMEREFSASPEKLFSFITQSVFLLDWWGPEGTTIAEHKLAFNEVGSWYAEMVSPGGEPHKVGGEVLSVDPPKSVELTLGHYTPSGDYGDVSTIKFEISPSLQGAFLTLTQTGLVDEYIPDIRDKGWASAFGRLEKLSIHAG